MLYRARAASQSWSARPQRKQACSSAALRRRPAASTMQRMNDDARGGRGHDTMMAVPRFYPCDEPGRWCRRGARAGSALRDVRGNTPPGEVRTVREPWCECVHSCTNGTRELRMPSQRLSTTPVWRWDWREWVGSGGRGERGAADGAWRPRLPVGLPRLAAAVAQNYLARPPSSPALRWCRHNRWHHYPRRWQPSGEDRCGVAVLETPLHWQELGDGGREKGTATRTRVDRAADLSMRGDRICQSGKRRLAMPV